MNSSKSSTGLSSGAKAGIGVGVALAVLIIAGLIFFLLRRRRKPSTVTGSLDEKYADSGLVVPPIEKSADSKLVPTSELSSTNELVNDDHAMRSNGGRFHEIGTSG